MAKLIAERDAKQYCIEALARDVEGQYYLTGLVVSGDRLQELLSLILQADVRRLCPSHKGAVDFEVVNISAEHVDP